MTDVCAECKFRELCEELEYSMDCTNQFECSHYDSYLEGMETVQD